MSAERVMEAVLEHPAQTAALAAAGAIVGSIALYHQLKPEKTFEAGENWYDIAASVDECIRAAGIDVQYVMLGGGGAAALMDPRTVLGQESKSIHPPADIWKPQFRRNGTKVDIDLLVFSDDDEVIKSVKAALEPSKEIIANGTDEERAKELAKPGAKLKVGVTGLRSGEKYDEAPTGLRKLLEPIKKDWVSHRLEYADKTRFVTIGDIKVELPEEYFEPWQLVLENGKTIPTLHPLIQAICYLSRTSHGIRRRDVEKVTRIMDNVGPQFGAHLVWGDKQQTARIVFDQPAVEDAGVLAAEEFCERKNALRWRETRERMGTYQAGLLAARIAIHRQLDTREIFVQFGQGGWLYDNVLANFTGEHQ
jgi:hypothetical protein